MKTWFLSSTGSGDLSLTIKGILLAVAPLLIVIGQYKGIAITESGIAQFADVITTFLSSAMIIWGIARKAYYIFNK